jgi:hypothetical protein
MGLWEQLNNPFFNVTAFSYIRNESGSNGFVLSAKQWIENTNLFTSTLQFPSVRFCIRRGGEG